LRHAGDLRLSYAILAVDTSDARFHPEPLFRHILMSARNQFLVALGPHIGLHPVAAAFEVFDQILALAHTHGEPA
jgi:hypothetical protein